MLAADRPFSLVLFGASGHLARIKIFPALYFLALKKRLPEEFSIVGYARTQMDDAQFREQFRSAVLAHVESVNEQVLRSLLDHVFYCSGQYDSVSDFTALAARLSQLERAPSVRLAYLSIPPQTFPSVINNLCRGGVHRSEAASDFRCIVEKPVGHDEASFLDIKSHLYECFSEQEVFILDHYLGKEAVRNVYYLRYANPVIERILKNTLIGNVQITASETHGLDGRAGYFDHVGTLRDMFQSHLLQMVALLTMRLTEGHSSLKAARLDALRKIYIPPAKDTSKIVLQGQYGPAESILSYRQEEGVAPHSLTPTFAILKVFSRAPRWDGVPFYLRSGKRMRLKETRISIEFQETMLIGKEYAKNRLDIILQGEAGLRFHLHTKLGGSEPTFRPLVMEDPLVCFGDCLVEHSLLLLEAINGHKSWFLDPEEVSACWSLIDPIQHALDTAAVPLYMYAPGTDGPIESDAFIARDGFSWL